VRKCRFEVEAPEQKDRRPKRLLARTQIPKGNRISTSRIQETSTKPALNATDPVYHLLKIPCAILAYSITSVLTRSTRWATQTLRQARGGRCKMDVWLSSAQDRMLASSLASSKSSTTSVYVFDLPHAKGDLRSPLDRTMAEC
jgi:hypothetical protein